MERKIVSVRAGERSIKIPAKLTQEQWKRFKALAEQEGRSMTSQVSWLIRRWLSQAEDPAAAPAAGFRIADSIRLVGLEEARDDIEMRDFWLSRSPEERIAETDRLRRLGYAIFAGSPQARNVALEARVVKRRR